MQQPSNHTTTKATILHKIVKMKDMKKKKKTRIKADRRQEAEDPRLLQIFPIFFSFHLFYPQQCCKRTVGPATINIQVKMEILCYNFLL